MTRFSGIYVALGALALLAALTNEVSAQLGAGPPPPTPRIYVRPPPIQQPSMWGINQNLQSERDRWQWGHRRGQKITGSSKYLQQ